MSCIVKIREGMNSFTDNEVRLGNYIIENKNEVTMLNAQDLGERVNTSAAAVVRFSKKLGYKGFTALKVDLAKQSDEEIHETFNTIIKEKDSIELIIKKAEAINKSTINQTYRLINIDILKNAIKGLKISEKIYIYGVGASGLIALDFQSKLLRVKKTAIYQQDSHMQTITAAHIGKEDIVVGLSYSGETKEVVTALKRAKENGAKTIAITKFNNNTLSKIVDYTLYIPNEEEELRIGAMTSRLATLLITDLLYLGIIKDNLNEVEKYLLETRQLIRELK